MRHSGPFATSIDDPALQIGLAEGLERVEQALLASVVSDDPFVSDVAKHLVDAGGKRFRPLLLLLSAEFGDATRPNVIPAAVIVELTHLATLYHDDVMDEAPFRRGAPSANARWDNTVAILTGDFLFARVSSLLADLGPDAVRIHAQTFERLVTGQIHETVGPSDDEDAVQHYLQVVADKTGSLIATSARYGAMFGAADPEVTRVLTEFGERVGVAFQLSDDLLDVLGDPGAFGKAQGTDLREGIPTLPGLYVKRASLGADERLLDLLSRPLSEDSEVNEALELLQHHPAIAEAKSDLAAMARQARALLEPLPEVPARRALAELCDAIVTRTT